MQSRTRRSRKAQLIGVLAAEFDEAFARPVIEGIKTVAEQYNYDVQIIAEEAYAEADFSGIVAIADAGSEKLLWQIHEDNVPLSLVSNRVPGLPVPSVMPNNWLGMTLLVEHIVSTCQRRNPVYVGGLATHADAIERERAFRTELLRYGLSMPVTHCLAGNFNETIAADAVRDFIKTGLPFDALIAADHLMGRGALAALRESKIAVPRQVSVAAFADDVAAEAVGLTTVAGKIIELGRCAARQVFKQIQGMHIRGVTTLGVQLIVRETT
jgi:LacI family transcriptional regulator